MSESLYDVSLDDNTQGFSLPKNCCVGNDASPTRVTTISTSRGKDLAQAPGGTFRIAADDRAGDLLSLYDKTGPPTSFDNVPVGYDRDTTTDNNYIR